MSIADETTLRIVLYEGTEAASLEKEERFSTMSALLENGHSVARTDSDRFVRQDRSRLLVLGKFSDGRPPSFDAGGDERGLSFENISGLDAEQIVHRVEEARSRTATAKPGEWKPWFPVIDYDRCTNCMQCLSFCLFGVYGVSEDQKIQVQNNDNCKTNCPACSRVCPEAAIMFPKYKAGPINGDLVSDADMGREKMKVDISSLLGGDVYAMLRDRSEKAKSRFSKERDSDKALTERQKCLTKLATSGDIPAEVLMSLPSPDEIQRRAAEATAKAQAAKDAIARKETHRD